MIVAEIVYIDCKVMPTLNLITAHQKDNVIIKKRDDNLIVEANFWRANLLEAKIEYEQLRCAKIYICI